ncbi:MAG TPA: bifunctional ADP-heptose synthase [Methylomirabilota bacterium]|jgi:rfaE bifunctional protein kinase chain/domain|nr:bifunctional ADP-heptose synthase [Methylomirabilota bacterium]
MRPTSGSGADRGFGADAPRLLRFIDAFPGKTILVLGDLVADEYVHGKPARISREAPVLILRYLARDVRLGGAANACHNLHALGARVLPLGVVGSDWAGAVLREMLGELGVPTDGVAVAADRITPVKTRIMAGGYGSVAARQQLVRVDREPEGSIPPAAEALLIDRLRAWEREVDAVVLSDYGYGTITPRLIDEVRRLGGRGALISADSRYDLLRFAEVTAATPSEPEVEQLLGVALDGDKAVEQAGWRLLERLGSRLLLVTRGSKGLALFERGGAATFIPVHGSDEIADVTGAGDTVISTFTLALASGAAPLDAARLANYAGGVVVLKRGTAPITRAELRRVVAHDDGQGARP